MQFTVLPLQFSVRLTQLAYPFRRVCRFFGRWRFLTNGDYNLVGFAVVFWGLGLIAFGLRFGLLGGLVLKDVGTEVRKQMPEGTFLELRVRVEPGWQGRDEMLDRFGY